MDPRLKVVIEVVDRASHTIARINTATVAQLRRLRLAILAVAATVAGFVTLAIKSSEAQRMAMARLEAHAGRMGPAFAVMVGEISRQLGRDLGFSKSDIAKLAAAMAELFGRPPLKFEIEAALILSRVTGMTAEQAAALINRLISGKGTEEDLKLFASLNLDVSKFTDPAAAATEIMEKLRQKAIDATGSTDKLKAAFANLFAVLGGGEGQSAFSGFIDSLTTVIGKITDFLVQHPLMAKALAAVVVLIAAITTAMGFLIGAMIIFDIVGAPLIAIIALIVLGLIIWIATMWLLWKAWKVVITFLAEKLGIESPSIIGSIALIVLAISGPLGLIITILTLKDKWKEAWDAIKLAVELALAPILAPINMIIKTAEKAIKLLQKLNLLKSQPPVAPPPSSPIPTGPILFDAQDRPVILTAQHGGRMPRSGLALVGEAGPELVAMPGGARVFPNNSTGGGITININGNVFGMPDLRRIIVQAVRDARRGGGFQDF